MFFKKKTSPEKARSLEKKGDRLLAKQKFDKAFEYYEKSWELNPERADIYPKLIESFEKLDREWTQEDFELTLSWTMAQQELENPKLKQVYEKFSPEYQTVQRLIQQFLVTPTETKAEELREKILSHGELATLSLLDFLQNIKDKIHQDSETENEQPIPENHFDEDLTHSKPNKA